MRRLGVTVAIASVFVSIIWATPSVACPPTAPPTFRIFSTFGQTIHLWLWPTTQQSVTDNEKLENCGWTRTEWQFATDVSQFVDYDYSKYRTDANYRDQINGKKRGLAAHWISGSNRFPPSRYALDIDLDHEEDGHLIEHATKYFVRVRALSDLALIAGRPTIFWSSPWSTTLDFVTDDRPCDRYLPSLFAHRPRDNAVGVATNMTFRLVPVDPVPVEPCLWDATEISLKWREGNIEKTRTESVARSTDLLTHTFSPPMALIGDTTYEWRARARSGTFSGKWTIVHKFTTRPTPRPLQPVIEPLQPLRPVEADPSIACVVIDPPTFLVPLHDSVLDVASSIELRIGFGANPLTCRHDRTSWQIYDATTLDWIVQTGFTRDNLTALKLPPNLLQRGKRYGWRVKVISLGAGPNGEDVSSAWSAESEFDTR